MNSNTIESSQDYEQVEITSLDHPNKSVDQNKRNFLKKTVQTAITCSTAGVLTTGGVAYLQYQRAEQLQTQLKAQNKARQDQEELANIAEMNANRQRDFYKGLRTLTTLFDDTDYNQPLRDLFSRLSLTSYYHKVLELDDDVAIQLALFSEYKEPRMTTIMRTFVKTQSYTNAAYSHKTDEWKGNFARMIAYLSVLTPISFDTTANNPLNAVDEAFGALRNLRPQYINDGGFLYPMRKQIRDNFFRSLQAVLII